MRILTFNILNIDSDYTKRRAVIAAGIQALQPDVIGFQEAELGPLAPGGHQVSELLAGQGYQVVHQFDHRQPAPSQHEGNCIASRWPVTLVEQFQYPETDRLRGYALVAQIARIDAPDPIGPFLFVNNKPAWRLDHEYERETQAFELVRAIEKHTRRDWFATVIAGDFDAAPDRASIRFLTGRQSLQNYSTEYWDAWESIHSNSDRPGFTWVIDNPLVVPVAERLCGDRSRRRIDYIFVANRSMQDRPARIADCQVALDQPVDGIWASDHFGVVADIECA
jgi:endonuclease/exonuclease/phosphatase family metal-dependent hydrolase